MVECVAAQQAVGLNGRFHGGELKIFFSKLAAWLRSPIALVFVFDGDAKPEIKRGTQVISKGLWWEELSKELIKLCGYYWVQVWGHDVPPPLIYP
jgi:Holliday junction resolvase YEN1